MKTRMEASRKDASEMRETLKKVQSGLERNFEGDRNDRGEFEEVANKLYRGQEMATKGMDEQRQAHSALEGTTKKLGNELTRTNVLIRNLEERLDEAAKTIKSMGRSLDETSTK